MSTALSYDLCLSKYSYVFSLDERVGVSDLFPNMEIKLVLRLVRKSSA